MRERWFGATGRKIPQIVLGYRKAGKLTVTVRVSRAAQRSLGKVKR